MTSDGIDLHQWLREIDNRLATLECRNGDYQKWLSGMDDLIDNLVGEVPKAVKEVALG